MQWTGVAVQAIVCTAQQLKHSQPNRHSQFSSIIQNRELNTAQHIQPNTASPIQPAQYSQPNTASPIQPAQYSQPNTASPIQPAQYMYMYIQPNTASPIHVHVHSAQYSQPNTCTCTFSPVPIQPAQYTQPSTNTASPIHSAQPAQHNTESSAQCNRVSCSIQPVLEIQYICTGLAALAGYHPILGSSCRPAQPTDRPAQPTDRPAQPTGRPAQSGLKWPCNPIPYKQRRTNENYMA